MEDIVILFFILMAIIVVIPIICLVIIIRVSNRLKDLTRAVHDINAHLTHQPIVEDAPQPEPEPIPMPELETIEEEAPEPAYAAVAQPEPEPIWVEEVPEEVFVPPVQDAPPAPKKPSIAFRFENLLSKIGIVTLVLGVGFFVKYAIDKEWINEIGRVAIGILCGGALIGVAHALRKKYDLFSAIMVGGGISVFYITITLAFREYALFSQSTAFVILILITILSVFLSLVYNRKELALFSLLGGYASPLMISTGEGSYIVLFTFLLVLNSGMLLIAMRRKWRVIGIVSFVCTLLFYWSWLLSDFDEARTGALCFAGLFFVQFYLLALADHFRSEYKISPFQVWAILANNLSLFAASIYIFNGTNVEVQGVLTILMAVVNAAVMSVLFRRKGVDKRLLYLIIAIVLSFVSLAVPMQLNGHVITMFWAAETVILLWLWNKSGIKVFYIGFILLTLLTVGSYLMDARYIYVYHTLPVIFNRIFITGLVVVAALYLNRYLMSKTTQTYIGVPEAGTVRKALHILAIGMTYLVPLLEIYYQFSESKVESVNVLTTLMIAFYSIIYLAVFTALYKQHHSISDRAIGMLLSALCLYLIVAYPVMIGVRAKLFDGNLDPDMFSVRYLALLALIYLVYVITTHIKQLPKKQYTQVGWMLVVFAVVTLSIEMDNIVIALWHTSEDYHALLKSSHTICYPILWGVLAMILMIWGLKRKEALLRKISLSFFGLIILKFYISDIWMMSQAGRIVSFVALGIILLFVSFVIQKIKLLIKDDETPDALEAYNNEPEQ